MLNSKLKTVVWAALMLLHGASFAEGSRSLYPAGYPTTGNASRASLDVSDPASKYANVVKRSGFLYVYALAADDYPVAMAFLFISAVLVVIATLLGDVLYTVVDPRIRFS